MPGVGGDALSAIIKQAAPNTPVIMLTGFGEFMAGQHPEGVDFLVSKPVTMTTLQQAIASVKRET